MRRILRKTLAFAKRDYKIEASYKLAFIMEIVLSIVPVVSFYFVGKLVTTGEDSPLAPYGGNYFAFVMVGIAFTQYFISALSIYATSVRRAQTTGVLEAILSTRTRPQEVILYSSCYGFLVSTMHIVVVFAVSGLLLGVDFSNADLLSMAATLVLTVAAFVALGILSATSIVILKKGDPVELVIGGVSSLLGGAFFPVEILPYWAQAMGKFLPITYALEAMRRSIFSGESIVELWRPLTILGGIAFLGLPLSVWAFSAAVERGRRDGSLVHY